MAGDPVQETQRYELFEINVSGDFRDRFQEGKYDEDEIEHLGKASLLVPDEYAREILPFVTGHYSRQDTLSNIVERESWPLLDAVAFEHFTEYDVGAAEVFEEYTGVRPDEIKRNLSGETPEGFKEDILEKHLNEVRLIVNSEIIPRIDRLIEENEGEIPYLWTGDIEFDSQFNDTTRAITTAGAHAIRGIDGAEKVLTEYGKPSVLPYIGPKILEEELVSGNL